MLIIALLLANAKGLGSAPNLYTLSIFHNESITSSTSDGYRITLGFGTSEFSGTASIRFQYPETNLTVHTTHTVHGEDSLLTGSLMGNLAYFSHTQDNGETSLTAAYALTGRTPCNGWPTIFRASAGLHAISSWSKNYDNTLWSITPHLALSLSQALSDHLYVKLFITTETLCLPEGNLSYYYGLSVALAITENLIVHVRPLLMLSDVPNESMFATLGEVSLSVLWTNDSHRNHVLEELGVWL